MAMKHFFEFLCSVFYKSNERFGASLSLPNNHVINFGFENALFSTVLDPSKTQIHFKYQRRYLETFLPAHGLWIYTLYSLHRQVLKQWQLACHFQSGSLTFIWHIFLLLSGTAMHSVLHVVSLANMMWSLSLELLLESWILSNAIPQMNSKCI